MNPNMIPYILQVSEDIPLHTYGKVLPVLSSLFP